MHKFVLALGFFAASAAPALSTECNIHEHRSARRLKSERGRVVLPPRERKDPYWQPCDYHSSTALNTCD